MTLCKLFTPLDFLDLLPCSRLPPKNPGPCQALDGVDLLFGSWHAQISLRFLVFWRKNIIYEKMDCRFWCHLWKSRNLSYVSSAYGTPTYFLVNCSLQRDRENHRFLLWRKSILHLLRLYGYCSNLSRIQIVWVTCGGHHYHFQRHMNKTTLGLQGYSI